MNANGSRDYQSKLKGVPRKQKTWEEYAALLRIKAEMGTLTSSGKPIAVYLLTDALIRLACIAMGEVVPIKMAYHMAAVALWDKINELLEKQGLPAVDISEFDNPDFHTGNRPTGLVKRSGRGIHAKTKKERPDA